MKEFYGIIIPDEKTFLALSHQLWSQTSFWTKISLVVLTNLSSFQVFNRNISSSCRLFVGYFQKTLTFFSSGKFNGQQFFSVLWVPYVHGLSTFISKSSGDSCLRFCTTLLKTSHTCRWKAVRTWCSSIGSSETSCAPCSSLRFFNFIYVGFGCTTVN